MCLTLASYSSVESGLKNRGLKNRVLVQNDGWKYQSFPLWLLCLVTIKFISIVEVTRLESLYTSVAYLYPCYCCQLEFSKNIFLTLSGWLCSLFICVYFFFSKWASYNCFSKFSSTVKSLQLFHLSTAFCAMCVLRSTPPSWVSFSPAPLSRFLVFSLYPQNPVTVAGCLLIHHCQLPHACCADGWLDCECDSAVCV